MRKCLFSFALLLLSVWAIARENPEAQRMLQLRNVSFIENKGQVTDLEGKMRADVRYTADVNGVKLYFRENAISYVFPKVDNDAKRGPVLTGGYRMDVELVNANPATQIVGEKANAEVLNYYYGHAPKGITNVLSYGTIIYKNVYNNIDLVFYGTEGGASIKYDFVVRPGGNPSDIKLRYVAANSLNLRNDGSIEATTPLGNLVENTPYSYLGSDTKTTVATKFELNNGILGFNVGEYDKNQTLVIDPLTLLWSTYYGANSLDRAYGTAIGSNGQVAVVGYTQNAGFPTTNGAFQTTFGGVNDAFAIQFNANGTRAWATFYGGTSIDQATSCAVDGSGAVYFTGYSSSTGFSATVGTTTMAGGGDAFIVKLNSTGGRDWATLIGGNSNDQGNSIALDNAGDVVVAGTTFSADLQPMAAFQSTFGGVRDAFLTKFTKSGTKVFLTFLGGAGDDQGMGVDVNSAGNIVIAGSTSSPSFPATSGSLAGGTDVFVATFSGSGSRSWATFWGGAGNEQANAVAIDAANNIVITGRTNSTDIATSNAIQTSFQGGTTDGFVAKMNSSGAPQWATYHGGSAEDEGLSIATDPSGNIFVAGITSSTGFPTAGARQGSNAGGNDAFVAQLSSAGSYSYGSYMGGSQNDVARGIAVNGNTVALVGQTSSLNFPVQSAFQSVRGGNDDAFVSIWQSDATGGCSLTVDGFPSNVRCDMPNSGSINITVTGGSGNYGYQWSGPGGFSSSSEDVSNLAAGDYSVTVVDRNNAGCTPGTQDFRVLPASNLNVSCTVDNDNRRISANVSNGNAPYTFQWTGPRGTLSTTGSVLQLGPNDPAGTYTVVPTDAGGCVGQSFCLYTGPIGRCPFFEFVKTDIACFGLTDGKLEVVTTAAPGTMVEYSLDGAPFVSNNIFIGLTKGNHSARARVVGDPSCDASHTFNIIEPPLLSILSVVPSNPRCNGGSDGCLNISVTGGTPPYRYSVNNGPSSPINPICNLASGVAYRARIVDVNNCPAVSTRDYTLTAPPALTASISNKTDAACFGEASGSVSIVADGGTPPYSYALNGGPAQFNGTFSNLPAGNHVITLRDQNGCTRDVPFQIGQPFGRLLVGIAYQRDATCFEVANGSITATATGGTPSYEYSINDGTWQRAVTFANLARGAYKIAVRDANGCIDFINTQLFASPPIDISVNAVVGVDCFGSSTGAIDVTVTGGIPPYEYEWSNGATSEDVSGLSAGLASLKVTDGLGCSTTRTISVPTQSGLELSDPSVTVMDVRCNGGASGIIDVMATGGTPPYSYRWAGRPDRTSRLMGLTAGSYQVTVTDKAGCNSVATYTVGQPALLQTMDATVTNVSCNAGSDGSIMVNVEGGVAPYSYVWSHGFPDQGMISGLSAGTYSVTVNDANGCVAPTQSITVGEPMPLMAHSSTQDLSCFESGDGVITAVNVLGGTEPYSFSIDGVDFNNTTGVFTGLNAGGYTLSVRDANGCRLDLGVTLMQPNEIIASILFKADIACFGLTDGKIHVAGSGGTGNANGFQFALDGARPFTRVQSYDGLTKGAHYVEVLDLGNSCIKRVPFTIEEPTKLEISNTSVMLGGAGACFPNGTVTITAMGGTTRNASNDFIPYQYSINGASGPYQLSNTFTNVLPGVYTVAVRDHNLCVATRQITVVDRVGASINTTPASCFGSSDGVISVNGTGGTPGAGGNPSFTYSLNGSPFQPNGTFSNLSAGTYSLRVMDSRGCMYEQAVSVSQRPSIQPIVSAIPGNEVCEGTSVSLSVGTNLPGGSALSYQWLDSNRNPIGGANGRSYTTMVSGTFYVDITNAGTRCTERSAGFVVIVNPDPRPSISTLTPNAPTTICKGEKVEIVANSVAPGILYNWYKDGIFVKGGIDNVYTVYETGRYTVNVVTDKQCQSTSSAFTVIVNPLPEANIYPPAKTVLCVDDVISLQSSRDINWSYQWNRNGAALGSSNDFMYDATLAGSYSVTITNKVTNCRATSPAVSLTSNPLAFSSSVAQPSACGAADGAITVTATGNIGATSYSVDDRPWSLFSGSVTVPGLISGTYHIRVRDAQCTVEDDVTVQVASPRISSVLGVTYNGIDLAWTGIPNARYDVDYRVIGANEWSHVENIANNTSAFDGAPIPSLRLTDLQHQSRYEIRVRARCLNGAISAWSAIERVTTPRQPTGRCFMPANIYVNLDPNNENQALVYWTIPVGGEFRPVCYDLDYRVKGTMDWFSLRVDGTQIPFRLRDLLTSTTYEARMRTNCVNCPGSDEARTSFHSPIIEFTTTNLCPEVGDLTLNGGTAKETVCGSLELMVDNLADQPNIWYQWLYSSDGVNFVNANGMATNRTYTGWQSGFYAAVVTVGNCEPVTTVPIELVVNQIPGVVANIVSHVSCHKGTNGSLQAGCTGENNICLDANGNPDYEFSIDGTNWQLNGLFENLTAGNYTIHVRKRSTGCQSSFTHPVYSTITEPGLPEFAVEWPGAGNIDVMWNPISGAIGYRIAYRIMGSGDNDWSYMDVNEPYNPNNLLPLRRTITDVQRNGSIYEVRIQTRCALDNTLSEWTSSKTVLVDPLDPLAGCVTPGGVFLSNITFTSARINWQPVARALSYIVEYRDLSSSEGFRTIQPIQGTSHTITGLVPGVQYLVRVRTRCSAALSDVSVPSEMLLFATSLVREEASPLAPEAISAFRVYPNPSNGAFTLDFNAVEAGDAQVTLTDLAGKTILNQTVKATTGNNRVTLDATGYAAGAYMLKFNMNGNSQVVKVIIN